MAEPRGTSAPPWPMGLVAESGGAMLRMLAAFGGVGAASTIVSFAAYRGMLLIGAHYVLAVSLAWGSALIVSFVGNRRLTFGVTSALRAREVAWFALIYGGQLAYSLVAYWLLLDVLALPPTVAFVLVMLPGSAMTFLGMRFLSFRPGPA